MLDLTYIQNNVSIIIPSRTIDFLLENCVAQIRKLYNSAKIILILDEYEESNCFSNMENIAIYKSVNRNMSAKRNLGVKNADTKYIAFIDSDAYPTDNWLQEAINFLEDNQEFSAVTGFWYNFPDDNLEQICLRLLRFSSLFTHSEWKIITDPKAPAQECSMMPTSDVIMRKADYDKIGGMNEDIFLAEDNDLSERLKNNGGRIMYIPEVSIYHRESKFLPYFKKLYCMNYYYSNMFLKGKSVKSLSQITQQFAPVAGIIFFLAFWILLSHLNINPYPLIILPLLVLVLITVEAFILTKKLKKDKLKGFFILLFGACIFCAVCVTGTALGLINFPSKDIKNYYRQY